LALGILLLEVLLFLPVFLGGTSTSSSSSGSWITFFGTAKHPTIRIQSTIKTIGKVRHGYGVVPAREVAASAVFVSSCSLSISMDIAEVATLKAIVNEVDPRAFLVIGVAHEALGEGFRPLKTQ